MKPVPTEGEVPAFAGMTGFRGVVQRFPSKRANTSRAYRATHPLLPFRTGQLLKNDWNDGRDPGCSTQVRTLLKRKVGSSPTSISASASALMAPA